MDFGSINRRLIKNTSQNKPSQDRTRRSFSTSNLSFTSTSSTSVGRRSIYLTLPKDFGCDLTRDGRVVHMIRGGPAHGSGVIQIGDYLRIYNCPVASNEETGDEPEIARDIVTVQVTYGVLQVDSRPTCPLVIKIGNKSNTSLGIALADTTGKKIKITSIQTGSLADRCGFLAPGDLITSIQISSNETIPCSPFYTSFQVAQILRKLASTKSSMTLTIVPVEDLESSDNNSGCSTVTLRDSPLALVESMNKSYYPSIFGNSSSNGGSINGSSNNNCNNKRFPFDNHDHTNGKDNNSDPNSNSSNGHIKDSRIEDRQVGAKSGDEDDDNEDECILSLCLWKDRLYEDWGFSLVDEDGDRMDARVDVYPSTVTSNFSNVKRSGAFVHQIRPGGPAFIAGLRPGDRLLQINDRDVKHLESTMLVPILACLDDALNVVISRSSSNLQPP